MHHVQMCHVQMYHVQMHHVLCACANAVCVMYHVQMHHVQMYHVQMQAEEYTSADAEVMELMDQHDKAKLDDPLAKLEHGNAVMARKKAENERLLDLKEDSAAKYKNDYAMNKLLRKNLRYVVDASRLVRPA